MTTSRAALAAEKVEEEVNGSSELEKGEQDPSEESCRKPGIAEAPPSATYGFAGAIPALGELTRPLGPGLGLGIGVEKLDRELFVSTLLFTTIEIDKIHLGIQLPLRFKVYDLDSSAKTFELRRKDWDEVSDFFKILRYAEYGFPRDTFYARLGELSGTTLGHGTIVNSYYNSIDIDHFNIGAQVNLNLALGGVETMLQSVSSPRLAGIRAYIRPWYLVDSCAPMARLALGTTLIVDGSAPTTLDGATVDSKNNLNTQARAMAEYGVDAEYPIITSSLLDLVPYSDLNIIGGQGSAGLGFHLGILAALHFPFISTQARFEYRRIGARYLAAYFDSLYEVQRYSFENDLTKLQFLDQGGNGEAKNGFYSELAVSFGNLFSIMGSFEDYQGPDNSKVQLRLALPEVVGLRLGLYYVKSNFEGLHALFDRDGALGIAEARYRIANALSLVGQIARQWRLENGSYEAVDRYNFGMQMTLGY